MSTNIKAHDRTQERSGATALALQIDRLMRLIHADIHPQAECFDTENVGPLGGMVLLTIAESEPIPIQSVVRRLGRDKSQMSRLINTLERKELLIKQPSPDDARVTLLKLAPRGQDQLQRIQTVLSSVIGNLFAPLSEKERTQFTALLTKVLSRADA